MERYPSFKPLHIDHKEIFDKAFKDNPPEISEFTFTNLFAWRETYKLSVSMLGGLLLLRSDSNKAPGFFTPVGYAEDTKNVIETVLKDTRGRFIRIPEKVKLLFDGDDRFKSEPDLDNSDYLFKTEDLIKLSGRKYDGKRNLIKKFRLSYNYEYIKMDAASAQGSLRFEEKWCLVKDCDGVEGLNNEREALKEMIKHFSDFRLIGGAIKAGDRICAIALGEPLNSHTFVMHMMKADPNMPGLYQTINNEFLTRELKGFKYLNLEQDLGVEGLRRAKSSYHPVDMVRKYSLELAR